MATESGNMSNDLWRPEMEGAERNGLPGRVARAVAARILSGEYPPGLPIPTEETLGQEFQISRVTVREGMKLLAAKGLVDSRPKRGTVVRSPEHWNHLDADLLRWRREAPYDEEFAQHLYEVRLLFEPQAAALAAERASDDAVAAIRRGLEGMQEGDWSDQVAADLIFHQSILDATGNPLLRSIGGAIATTLVYAFNVSRRPPDDYVEIVGLHRELYEAIERHDPDAAFQLMTAIAERGASDFRAALKAMKDREPEPGLVSN